MIKSTDSKFSRNLLLLIVFVLFYCLCGCDDTDKGTIVPDSDSRILTVKGPDSLAAGQSSIITVNVTNGDADKPVPVREQEVTFTIPSNNSGGTLTILNKTTDANGQALALYTAGSNSPNTDVEDTVQASVEGASGAVTIKRTAGTNPVADSISEISSLPPAMTGGQMSIITAKVTTGTATEEGSTQTITFTIPANNSGANFIDSEGASVPSITATMKMSQGNILAISVIYKAGTNDSGKEVQDIVQAVLGNGSTNYIIITRSVTQ
jgi:hypothetical protein